MSTHLDFKVSRWSGWGISTHLIGQFSGWAGSQDCLDGGSWAHTWAPPLVSLVLPLLSIWGARETASTPCLMIPLLWNAYLLWCCQVQLIIFTRRCTFSSKNMIWILLGNLLYKSKHRLLPGAAHHTPCREPTSAWRQRGAWWVAALFGGCSPLLYTDGGGIGWGLGRGKNHLCPKCLL